MKESVTYTHLYFYMKDPYTLLLCSLSVLNDLEYSKVTVRGTFDHTREAYLGPRSLQQEASDHGGLISAGRASVGMNVITAFKVKDRK